MSTKSSLRVVINAGKQARRLFSIGERRTGDLFFSVVIGNLGRDHTFSRELSGTTATHNLQIREQRISLHPSKDSRENNQIKFTMTFVDGTTKTLYHVTDAIKRKNGYVFLFGRRVPDLLHTPAVTTHASRRVVSLGNYDPNEFMLFFSVYVASREYQSPIETGPDISVTNIAFGEYQIVVLHSFAPVPSHSSGLCTATQTVSTVDTGFRPDAVVGDFRRWRDMAFAEMIDIANRQWPHIFGFNLVVGATLRYFGKAEKTDPDYISYKKWRTNEVAKAMNLNEQNDKHDE